MEKDKSAIEEFLGEEFSNKGKDPFDQTQDDPFATQENTQETETEETKEEKPLPFHKDPKVQKFIDKEISKRMAEIKPEPVLQKEKETDDDYYVRLIGNDTPEKVAMIKEAIARDERMLSMAEDRAFNRLSQKEQETVSAEKENVEFLLNAVESIEEEYGIDISSNNQSAQKTRQEFLSFVEKIAPKDGNGDLIDYPDMNSAWETYQEIKKSTAQPSRAKELASRSMSRSASTETAPKRPINRVPFESTDSFLESLER